MRFSNGSSYSVTTSARSGTVQRLHITEFGKICRKSPDKAEEIMSGSLNTVHQGQQIVIESTAQGASGHFFNLCSVAERKMRMKTCGWDSSETKTRTQYYKPLFGVIRAQA